MRYEQKKTGFSIKDNPIIMGIETSCDETAVAIIKNGREILADEIISSATEHVRFGGVVPEIASRMHTTAILKATQNALDKAGLTLEDIDALMTKLRKDVQTLAFSATINDQLKVFIKKILKRGS